MKYLFIAAILISNVADAQYCGRNLRFQPTYAPVQQVVQNYGYYDYVQQPLIVGIPVQNFGLNYYYSVGDELREERIAELVAQQLTLKLNQSPPSENPEPEQPSQEVSQNIDPTNVDNSILTLFTNSCIMCHGAGKDAPGVKLFNEDGSLYVDTDPLEELLRRDAIYEAVFGGNTTIVQMPKGGSPLSDEEVDLIRQWKNQFTGELR